MSDIYTFTIRIKIKNQDDIENLYKFCNTYREYIRSISYLVKRKIFEIIVKVYEKSKDIDYFISLITAMFENLKYPKDFEVYYITTFTFKNPYNKLWYSRLSYTNTRMYLYFKDGSYGWDIRYIPKIMYEILYNFKISDMNEIICWSIIFFKNYINSDYKLFIRSCVKRYYDKKHKIINIQRFKGICGMNGEKITRHIKNYMDYDYEFKGEASGIKDDEHPYISIDKIPNVYLLGDFMDDILSNNSCFNIDTFDLKESEIKKEEEIDYNLDILFLQNKENSVIENNIFNNNEEDYDEEYLEITRSRRIKKNFAISINN